MFSKIIQRIWNFIYYFSYFFIFPHSIFLKRDKIILKEQLKWYRIYIYRLLHYLKRTKLYNELWTLNLMSLMICTRRWCDALNNVIKIERKENERRKKRKKKQETLSINILFHSEKFFIVRLILMFLKSLFVLLKVTDQWYDQTYISRNTVISIWQRLSSEQNCSIKNNLIQW